MMTEFNITFDSAFLIGLFCVFVLWSFYWRSRVSKYTKYSQLEHFVEINERQAKFLELILVATEYFKIILSSEDQDDIPRDNDSISSGVSTNRDAAKSVAPEYRDALKSLEKISESEQAKHYMSEDFSDHLQLFLNAYCIVLTEDMIEKVIQTFYYLRFTCDERVTYVRKLRGSYGRRRKLSGNDEEKIEMLVPSPSKGFSRSVSQLVMEKRSPQQKNEMMQIEISEPSFFRTELSDHAAKIVKIVDRLKEYMGK